MPKHPKIMEMPKHKIGTVSDAEVPAMKRGGRYIPPHPKKGTPEAKAFMAKLRDLRRKKH